MAGPKRNGSGNRDGAKMTADAEAPSHEVGGRAGGQMVEATEAAEACPFTAPLVPVPAPPPPAPVVAEDNLFAALSRAQGIVTGVAQDRRNTFHKYKYASSEALIAEGSVALSACGLALIPLSQGLINNGADLHRKFFLVHRSGDKLPLEITCPVFEEKGRPLDKAMWGACTQSLGYLLRDLLLMPRVDEKDEPDAREERQPAEEPRVPRGRAAQAPAAAPAPAPATNGEATATATAPATVKAKPGKATQDQLARMVRAKKDWFALAGLDKDAFGRAWNAEVARYGVQAGTDLLPAQADDLLAQVAGKITRLEAEREVDRQIALDREDAMARAAEATTAVNAATKGDADADAIPY